MNNHCWKKTFPIEERLFYRALLDLILPSLWANIKNHPLTVSLCFISSSLKHTHTLKNTVCTQKTTAYPVNTVLSGSFESPEHQGDYREEDIDPAVTSASAGSGDDTHGDK